jgi:tRNA 2-thiouridine synthesizing protein A
VPAKVRCVDARGRPCPLPIIELAKAVRGSGGDEELELWATDPAVEGDLLAWCGATGHELLCFGPRDGWLSARIRVRRGGAIRP